MVVRQRTVQALRMKNDLDRRIVDSVPCGIVQVSLEGEILEANSVARTVLGLTFDQATRRFVARCESIALLEDGSVCPAQDHPVSKCLATRQPQPATTIGVRRVDGQISWGIVTVVPTSNSGTDEMTGVVVTILDVTERKQLEEQLCQS